MIRWLNFYVYYVAIAISVFILGWVTTMEVVPKPVTVTAWLLVIGYAYLAHGYRSMYWEVQRAGEMLKFIKGLEKQDDGTKVTAYTFDESKDSRDKDQTKED